MHAVRRLLQRSVITHSTRTMLNVTPIPALDDNYMYLLTDTTTNQAAIVDPVNPDKVMAALRDVNLTHILTTHHHWDHAGGNAKMIEKFGKPLTVCGGDAKRIEKLNKLVKHGEEFKIGSITVKCLSTPCHTSTHICYYCTDETGDTLFIGGCGRFFEGTAQQMYDALCVTLAGFPDDTAVWPGHEYTVANLKFAVTVDAKNGDAHQKLIWAENMREGNGITIPSTIGEEKLFNPFMRVGNEVIQKHFGSNDPIEVMQKMRDAKNNM